MRKTGLTHLKDCKNKLFLSMSLIAFQTWPARRSLPRRKPRISVDWIPASAGMTRGGEYLMKWAVRYVTLNA
jgi:hypothetical protein